MPYYKDMAIPEIKIVQNVGGDEAKAQGANPGDFYCALTGEVIPGNEGFELVLSERASVERTYWGPNHEVQSDDPPICSSWDGMTSNNGDECQTDCPYNAFCDAPGLLGAEERKAKCTPGFKVTGISLTNMMPVFIRCSGWSAGAARELNFMITFHKNMKGQFYKAKFRVSTIKRKGTSGEAFVIKFGQPELLSPESLTEVKQIIESMIGEALPELTSTQQVQKALTPGIKPEEPIAELARAAQNLENAKAASGISTQTGKVTLSPIEPPGTVVLGKKESSGNTPPRVNTPPAVQKLAAEVKKKLPEMNF
jgi:hypothetical protein